VAVQSHFFGVGSIVSWAEAGVGTVATQSLVEPAYGPRGLDLMREGKSAPAALQQLISDDPEDAVRQAALVDRGGRVAVHTGRRCIGHAGHAVGDQVSAQANMMERDTVPAAMIRAYSESRGEGLAERMLAALEAAEGEGGDIRGRQSAAMVVVTARATGRPVHDRPVDLRVEDHPDPVRELRRLLALQRAYALASAGDDLAGAGDMEGALAEYEAAHRLQPDNQELAFWHGLALAATGREAEAAATLRPTFEAHAGWIELLKRLPAAGLFPDDAELIARLAGTRAVSEPTTQAPPASAPPAPGPPAGTPPAPAVDPARTSPAPATPGRTPSAPDPPAPAPPAGTPPAPGPPARTPPAR
jgi:uncharacterized Ntn-hydrolase superfamily protein